MSVSQPNFEASAPSTQIGQTSVAAAATRKQEFNIYTLMLIISFIALLIGTLLLFLELNKYGTFPGTFPWKTTNAIPSTSSLVFDVANLFRL